MHLITPKIPHFSDYDFEIESNGVSKHLNSKPEITNYKLKSERDREYTLTISRLKIEKNNNIIMKKKTVQYSFSENLLISNI